MNGLSVVPPEPLVVLPDDVRGPAAAAAGHTFIAVEENSGAVFGTAHGTFNVRHATADQLHVHVARRVIEAQQLGPAHVRDLLARHVPRRFRRWGEPGSPLSQEEALAGAADASCVVLLGEPDSGLRSAAVAVLAALAGAGRLHTVPIDDVEDAEDDPLTEALRFVERGAGYLLRLPESAVDPHLAERCEGHGNRLRQHGSWLVVTASPRTWRAVGGVAGSAVLAVDPPPAAALLRQTCGPDVADRLMREDAMRDLLDGVHGTTDGARLARIAAEVTAGGDGGAEQWVAHIEGAVHDWSGHLEKLYQGLRGAPQRCFLIAAAMLAGHPATVVSEAAHDLRRTIEADGPAGDAVDVCGDSVSTLVAAVDAALDDQRLLTWPRPRYAEAVLHYLHTEYPPRLWSAVWRWAIALPREDGDRGAALAGRVSEQALRVAERYGDTGPLWQLLSWWERPALRPHLVDALTVAALGDPLGRRVRERLYEWATKRIPNPHHHLVAQVCRGEFAEVYPRVSLTRLGHLADVADAALHVEVAESIRGMWTRRALRPQVLRALATWAGADLPRSGPAVDILVELLAAGPSALAGAGDSVRGALTDALAAGYGAGRPGRHRLLHALLGAAAAVPEGQAVLAGVIVEAVTRPGPAITRIAHLCADLVAWCPPTEEDPGRRQVRDVVHQALHQANPLVTGARR
ncbi:hypothetical protein GCM10010124_21900 [Pilimelia terevasa]|uniref:Uncharacterized protein n=1 Tax=Pilimelia terevasa TaxID=53372 RepID=A0A8J3BKU8_9ACTN|nr:hypothetical protein [Pilimelia terevasa]GGK28797.1 hypothetical protein GCM10010124_21900 [Pilimelia terevasa]